MLATHPDEVFKTTQRTMQPNRDDGEGDVLDSADGLPGGAPFGTVDPEEPEDFEEKYLPMHTEGELPMHTEGEHNQQGIEQDIAERYGNLNIRSGLS